MTSKVWIGLGLRVQDSDFASAAQALECDVPAIKAVWEVEAAGRPYRSDGSVERRFEPHHMPNSSMNWRESLRLSRSARERMFDEAYQAQPEAALKAASWGAPQIMGFNHRQAGYGTAHAMVEAFAESEVNQLEAFVSFILASQALTYAIRSQDWRAFALHYNGSGKVDDYAPKMASAYLRQTGRGSVDVLSIGDRGSHVRELQRALGIQDDGIFGPGTKRRVVEFQTANGLAVDGIVGSETWGKIREITKAKPPAAETKGDNLAKKIGEIGAAVGGAGGVAAIARELPPFALNAVIVAACAIAVLAIGTRIIRRSRRRT